MRIIPIAEILEMDDKEPIRATSGTVTKIYKQKTFSGGRDGGTIQLMQLKSGRDQIDLKAFDQEEVPQSWRGKKVIIESHSGEKGMSGAYAFDDKYNGKPSRIIKMTATGQIYLDKEDDDAGAKRERGDDDAPRQRRSAEREPTRERPPADPPPARQRREDPPPLTPEQREAQQERAVLDTKKQLARAANLYCLALDVVDVVIFPHYKTMTGGEMPEALYQQAVASMFIGARDSGADALLPIKPISLAPAAAQPTSTPPPEAPPPRQAAPPPDDDEIPF